MLMNFTSSLNKKFLKELRTSISCIIRVFIILCNTSGFCRLFWKTSFLVFLSFLYFLPAQCRIRCTVSFINFLTLRNRCLHSSRFQLLFVFVLTNVKIVTRLKNLSAALNPFSTGKTEKLDF